MDGADMVGVAQGRTCIKGNRLQYGHKGKLVVIQSIGIGTFKLYVMLWTLS